MATYTVTIDGKNAALKKALELIIALGGKVVERDTECSLDKSIAEYKAGKTYKAKSAHDLIEKCMK